MYCFHRLRSSLSFSWVRYSLKLLLVCIQPLSPNPLRPLLPLFDSSPLSPLGGRAKIVERSFLTSQTTTLFFILYVCTYIHIRTLWHIWNQKGEANDVDLKLLLRKFPLNYIVSSISYILTTYRLSNDYFYTRYLTYSFKLPYLDGQTF